MINIIIIAILVAVVGTASFYIWKEKKKGNKCIGCPYSGSAYRAECKVEDEELMHLELMVNAVLIENIIDDFEVLRANNEALLFDEEQNYKVKCLIEKVSWYGFYSEFYNPEAPFEIVV